MFHPERDLRLVILDILKEDGKSISAISRELEARGYDLHRLILTGYLRAMTDLNVLKEKEVPPSKIYIPVKGRAKDIYETIGEKVRLVFGEGEKSDSMILFTLVKTFKRPIFADELAKTGLKNVVGREVSREERQEAKQVLAKSGFKVPDSLKAYSIEAPELEREYSELVARMLVDVLDAGYLIRETKQTRLTF
jgi:hypothetical protein